MKVIGTDNFDRDTVSDILVAESLTEEQASDMAREMNSKTGMNGPRYYEAVPDNYKLFVWKP